MSKFVKPFSREIVLKQGLKCPILAKMCEIICKIYLQAEFFLKEKNRIRKIGEKIPPKIEWIPNVFQRSNI